MNTKRKFLKKGDSIVLLAVAAVALLLLLCGRFLYPSVINGAAEITVDGELYGSYPLKDGVELIIETPGGNNTVMIENGVICVKNADCPDHLCVKQGGINRRGETIVCLPHKLVITVKDAASDDVDITI